MKIRSHCTHVFVLKRYSRGRGCVSRSTTGRQKNFRALADDWSALSVRGVVYCFGSVFLIQKSFKSSVRFGGPSWRGLLCSVVRATAPSASHLFDPPGDEMEPPTEISAGDEDCSSSSSSKFKELEQKISLLASGDPSVDGAVLARTWKDAVRVLQQEDAELMMAEKVIVLRALKIVTRNKHATDTVLNVGDVKLLLSYAGYCDPDQTGGENLHTTEVMEEALKCLSNIYLQCYKAHTTEMGQLAMDAIIGRMDRYAENGGTPHVLINYDMRLLFLVTAFCAEMRTVFRVGHHGIKRLTDLLQHTLGIAFKRSKPAIDLEKGQPSSSTSSGLILEETDVDIIASVLKVLFNCTCNIEPSLKDNVEVYDEGLMLELKELCKLLHTLLTVDTAESSLENTVVSNCVNLLTNYPSCCMDHLTDPLDRNLIIDADKKEIVYEGGAFMNAPNAILEYLMNTLNKYQNGFPTISTMRDSISPVLKVLCSMSTHCRWIRRYFRQIVLPPLNDVSKRPEEGNSIRNRLCHLLTSPEDSVSTMVAEFLFILCKENVGRFVKHTGYGNAAGLLARRGLMLGGRGHVDSNKYSDSDDEDSDTEEYLKNVHKINPVTGFIEPTRPSPFEGMSEEQKEYEAIKLANLMDRLHNLGIVQPAKLGIDGKPVAVSHVLELVENQAASRIPDLCGKPDSRPSKNANGGLDSTDSD